MQEAHVPSLVSTCSFQESFSAFCVDRGQYCGNRSHGPVLDMTGAGLR
jgi:hypothetical protein